jgi:hypothetical protein
MSDTFIELGGWSNVFILKIARHTLHPLQTFLWLNCAIQKYMEYR